jgi:predicted NBD/HSP70 family sugar kinase
MYVPPRVAPPLDPDFRPAALSLAERALAAEAGRLSPLHLAVQRGPDAISALHVRLPAGDGDAAGPSARAAERLAKSLLWACGGYRLVIGGPEDLVESVRAAYADGGPRSLDRSVMSAIYDRPFEVETAAAEDVPAGREVSSPLGRHLDGCRIGLDLGGTDRKVAAVRDGRVLYTEEVAWDPKGQADPAYHHEHIQEALKAAAARLPRVDAIGVSAAGVYQGNRVRLASLFRGVPVEVFDAEAAGIFERIGEDWGVPLAVANDGDVAALAGSMSLGEGGVLGLALGTSLAAGYVDDGGNITGRLNELASVPLDWRPEAPAKSWSRDAGAGSQYLSQEAVFRLAAAAGLDLDFTAPKADQLRAVQALVADSDPAAIAVMETIGCYLGYALAYYATFYRPRHILLLGRVVSGPSGAIALRAARRVLDADFPELAGTALHLPDEEMRRLGQSVAAASLPARGPAA